MYRREILAIGLAGLLAIANFGAVAKADETGPITIGLIANLTGTDVRTSVNMTRGVEMAVNDINAAGGVNGRMIRLITEDSEYRAQEAMNAATKLYDVDGVEVAIMFGGSSLMIPVGGLAQDKGKVLINTSSSSPKLGEFPGTLFSVLPLDDIMGKALGEWGAEQGIKTAAFVVPNNTFGVGLMDATAAAFEAAGGEVVAKVAYTEGQPDYRADLQTIAKARPDAIFVTGYGDDSRTVFANAQRLGIEANWYAAYPTILSIADPDWLNGRFFGVDNGGTSLPSSKDLAARYKNEYGEEPLAHVFYGYDAAQIVARSMAESGTSAEQIKQALPQVVDAYSGATGKIVWDESGQRVDPPIEFVAYKDGEFVVLATNE